MRHSLLNARAWLLHARALLVALLGAGLLGSIAPAQTPGPPSATPKFKPEFGVIFPAERTRELLRQCSRPFVTAESTFTPNAKHLPELERRLAFELEKALRLVPGADKNLRVQDYYRQYTGIVLRGRHVIYVNGFHRHHVEADAPDWRTKAVIVCDGGEAYWHAAYDPERRTFVLFQFKKEPGTKIVFNGVA